MSRSFLGSAPVGPFHKGEAGRVEVKSEQDLVQDSLDAFFRTPRGSRVMRNSHGAGMSKFLFETIDNVILKVLEADLKIQLAALSRLDILNLQVIYDINDNLRKLEVRVEWRVAGTNKSGNQVFPFFLEGR